LTVLPTNIIGPLYVRMTAHLCLVNKGETT